jgi:hypothetical protein
MKVVTHTIALAFGAMLAAIWILGNAPDCPAPANACVPLYNQTGLETWVPSADCPAPTQKGE